MSNATRMYCYAPQRQAVMDTLGPVIPNIKKILASVYEPHQLSGLQCFVFVRIVTYPQQPAARFLEYLRALGAVEWLIDDSAARARYRERFG